MNRIAEDIKEKEELQNLKNVLAIPEVNKDIIVENVVSKYRIRSKIGIEKYKSTLQFNNKDNFLLHAQQEAMDLSLYLEKLIVQKQELTSLVNNETNDAILGAKVRELIR